MQVSEIRKSGRASMKQDLVGQCKKLDFYLKYSKKLLDNSK